ncbi:MAG: CDP-diacylglycerol--glycerol-3-phosphate 3-phosphatidyltransferase [Gammaproteobacteria bacterium]|nr:CDP-diacylglycerol--glycerol-3-phosphate 3-phosphatidyltransferase [Gammaproteobacteria bacterium]
MSTSTAVNDKPQVNGWLRHLPIALTWMRVILVPVFVVVFYMPETWAPLVATVIYGLAGITDWFDGWLARRWGVVSRFGAFLDPVADKIMVAVALVLLVQVDGTLWLALPAAVIIGREITVSALREWMAESGIRGKVAVSWIGKVKTTLQMVAIGFLIFRYDVLIWPVDIAGYSIGVYDTGLILLVAAAALTLWSMLDYLIAAWRATRNGQ